MSVGTDYRMHPEDCGLFKSHPEITRAVLDLYVTYEKECAKARKELNHGLKEIFAPFEPKNM
jgi:hypothetical protein